MNFNNLVYVWIVLLFICCESLHPIPSKGDSKFLDLILKEYERNNDDIKIDSINSIYELLLSKCEVSDISGEFRPEYIGDNNCEGKTIRKHLFKFVNYIIVSKTGQKKSNRCIFMSYELNGKASHTFGKIKCFLGATKRNTSGKIEVWFSESFLLIPQKKSNTYRIKKESVDMLMIANTFQDNFLEIEKIIDKKGNRVFGGKGISYSIENILQTKIKLKQSYGK